MQFLVYVHVTEDAFFQKIECVLELVKLLKHRFTPVSSRLRDIRVQFLDDLENLAALLTACLPHVRELGNKLGTSDGVTLDEEDILLGFLHGPAGMRLEYVSAIGERHESLVNRPRCSCNSNYSWPGGRYGTTNTESTKFSVISDFFCPLFKCAAGVLSISFSRNYFVCKITPIPPKLAILLYEFLAAADELLPLILLVAFRYHYSPCACVRYVNRQTTTW
jgi:hypothetical protein